MHIIGLTGGIGSGKSTVSARLAELGATVVDADLIAREVVEPGEPALAELGEAFTGVIRPDGTLDRAELARQAFASQQGTETLNSITHPRIPIFTPTITFEAKPNAVLIKVVIVFFIIEPVG